MTYDSSIRRDTLRNEIGRYDKRKHHDLTTADGTNSVLDDAVHVASTGFDALIFAVHTIKGKPVYQLTQLSHDLVLRRLNRNLRMATSVRQADRDTVVKRIISLLSEGVQHRVYKLDVKDFYESLDRDYLVAQIRENRRVTRHSERLTREFLDHCEQEGVTGVPRGIALSATLAELALAEFDSHVRSLPDVYFYARYVDDIFILTNGRENPSDFRSSLASRLPPGLQFNPRKSNKDWLLEKGPGPNIPARVSSFDFLGYEISYYTTVRDKSNRVVRRVDVDLSQRKVKRIKTRLVRAALTFLDDHMLSDFEQRIRILTGNYNLVDFDADRTRNVGLYCNYRRIGLPSPSLRSLDDFYRQLLLGHAGAVSQRLKNALSAGNLRALLKYSFTRSFVGRTYYNVPSAELGRLTKCWSYV